MEYDGIRVFLELAEVQNSLSHQGIAGKYRNRRGADFLFRTIGLLSMAKAIKIASGKDGALASRVCQVCQRTNGLGVEPWVGLFWDPNEKTMINKEGKSKYCYIASALYGWSRFN